MVSLVCRVTLAPNNIPYSCRIFVIYLSSTVSRLYQDTYFGLCMWNKFSV
jgi:hypothetical protein